MPPWRAEWSANVIRKNPYLISTSPQGRQIGNPTRQGAHIQQARQGGIKMDAMNYLSSCRAEWSPDVTKNKPIHNIIC